MYKVFIQPTYAYNIYERELQVIELSYLVRSNEGNIIKREDLKFQPILGVDDTLLRWLEIEEKKGYGNIAKEEVKRVIEELNTTYFNCELISWYDELTPLPKIENTKELYVYNILRTNMRTACKDILGKEVEGHKADYKLDLLIEIYDKAIKEERPLSQFPSDITSTISNNPNEI